jgi:undecaprenyl pyrophosphate synthase
MNMKNDEQGPMENLLDGLDEHSDSLSSDQLKAELLDRGIDLDAGLKKAEMTIAVYDKEDRLSWMKVADEKRKSLTVAETSETSWVGRKAEEIKAAFDAFVKSTEKETAFAFRNKSKLSVEDMAQILDSNEKLKHRSTNSDKSKK